MQAARGASLNPSVDAHPDSSDSPAGDVRLRILFVVVFLVGYVADVGSKILAVEKLTGRPDIEIVGEWFQLHLTRNPGAAFSTGGDFTPALSLLAIAASGVVVYLARGIGSRWWAVSLGLLLAGITGNLTDRIFRSPGPLHGEVVDFLQLPNWPIFNVADICINAGAALTLLLAFRGISVNGSRVVEPVDDAPGDPLPGEPSR